MVWGAPHILGREGSCKEALGAETCNTRSDSRSRPGQSRGNHPTQHSATAFTHVHPDRCKVTYAQDGSRRVSVSSQRTHPGGRGLVAGWGGLQP